MFNFITIVIVSTILAYFPGIAQSNDFLNSTNAVTSYGLIFEKESDYKLEGSTYTVVIQLLGLTKKANALQFRILMNKAPDDSTVLIFKDIQKGSDLSDSNWLLDFNVIKGPIAKNEASRDEALIVLYSLNQSSGLLPGDYNNLFTVNYKVAKIPGLNRDIKSSMKISNAEASTFDGFAIDIKPTRDEYKIHVRKK